MIFKDNLMRNEEKNTGLETFCLFEKASGVLKDIRKEFKDNPKQNPYGMITVEEYSNSISEK